MATGSTTGLQVVGQVLLALLVSHFILVPGPILCRKRRRATGNHRNPRDMVGRIWGLFLRAPMVVIVKVICDCVAALRGTVRMPGD